MCPVWLVTHVPGCFVRPPRPKPSNPPRGPCYASRPNLTLRPHPATEFALAPRTPAPPHSRCLCGPGVRVKGEMSGAYFYRLEVGQTVMQKKMLFVK